MDGNMTSDSTDINDKFFSDLSVTIIISICLIFNVFGFLTFYFNKTRQKTNTLLPNLIMLGFFFQGLLNYSSIAAINYRAFFINNSLPIALDRFKIFSIISGVKKKAKVINGVIIVLSFCSGLINEILYCFESIHLFKNPISACVVRRVVYTIILLVSCVINCIVSHIYFISKADQISINNYITLLIDNLFYSIPIVGVFIVISIFSVPVIFLSIKTSSVLFTAEKEIFKMRHLLYSIFTNIVLIVYTLIIGYPDATVKGNFRLVILITMNCYGICGGFFRFLEIDLIKGIKALLCSDKYSNKQSDFNYKAFEEFVNFVGESATENTVYREKKGEIEAFRESLGLISKSPLTARIKSNFLSESVYYIVNVINNSSVTNSSMANITEKDYSEFTTHTIKVEKHQITSIESDNIHLTPSNGYNSKLYEIFSNKIQIIEYAPKVFHNLLLTDGIDEFKIRKSFDVQRNLYNLAKFQGSEGKSGSIFFFTFDKKFIIKTISEKELNGLMDNLLQSYYTLIAQSNFSLLMRIYGAFTLKMGRSVVHVVMMENLAPFSNDAFLYKFDLKGSLSGRKTDEIFAKKTQTLKDLDYLEISDKEKNAKIDLSSEDIKNMKTTMKDDLDLVEKANLMDYSMFVVVAKKDKVDPKEMYVKNRIYQSRNNPNIVYLLGIIDYLTSYGKLKKFENFAKRIVNKKGSYSAVSPVMYRDRFYKFMFDKIFFNKK